MSIIKLNETNDKLINKSLININNKPNSDCIEFASHNCQNTPIRGPSDGIGGPFTQFVVALQWSPLESPLKRLRPKPTLTLGNNSQKKRF